MKRVMRFAEDLDLALALDLLRSLRSRRAPRRIMRLAMAAAVLLIAPVSLFVTGLQASDLSGRYSASPLRDWISHLASRKGPCCDLADGVAVDDPDWDTRDGHFRVRVQQQWIDVPGEAVIGEPNRLGKTMVWLVASESHDILIRCFLPGPMT